MPSIYITNFQIIFLNKITEVISNQKITELKTNIDYLENNYYKL